MYKSRGKFDQFDVVDIDPYGSASIFIDGAVQCVKSGGYFYYMIFFLNSWLLLIFQCFIDDAVQCVKSGGNCM